MNQNNCIPNERDLILLAMEGHDVKEILGAVCVVLNTYLQDMSKCVNSSDAPFFAACVEDMQCAGKEMMLCIDEILAILDEGNTALEPLRIPMQFVYGSSPFTLKHVPYVASNGQYEVDLHEPPPTIYMM